MKSILIFADHFFPGNAAGGPVTSISNLYTFLERTVNVTIVTRNSDFSSRTPYKNVVFDSVTKFSNYSIIYLSRLAMGSILFSIRLVKPDIIYLNSLFSVFTRVVLLLHYFKLINCKIYLAPRGEFQKNAIAMKRNRKLVYIRFLKLFRLPERVTFHATDQIEAERIYFFFNDATVVTLPNLPRPILGTPRKKMKSELRLIFIGRILSNKNLLYALRMLSNSKADLTLDIYGPIEDEIYWSECTAVIHELGPNLKICYKGLIPHESIPVVLLEYHALLLPTETENFGHAIVEAMQMGVVPIISDQTPWRNLAEFGAGWDIDLSRPDLFFDAVHKLYAMDSVAYTDLSASTIRYIQGKLKIDELGREYARVFNES